MADNKVAAARASGNHITQERLQELVHYDPETGVFRWAVNLGSRARSGAIAGCLDRRGYRVIRLDKALYTSAQLAWLYVHGVLPRRVGHENGVQDDDRITNLFDADSREVHPLTQARVRDLLFYDPATGEFWWKRHGPGRNADVPAGCFDQHGYRVICIDYVLHRAGRLAWLYVHGEFPDEVDHKNRVRDDDRIENLRMADRAGNNRNRGLNKNNTSGCKGIYWSKPHGKWHARVMVNRKHVHVGLFDDLNEAKYAVEQARKRLHGDFACST